VTFFYWRGQGFLISIAMPLRIMFIDALTKSETRGYLKSILEVHIGKLSDHGFVVRTIFVDPQRALEALDGSLNVPVDVTGARRHVGVIERNIRTIKERMRAVECGLPYKCPQRLVRGLAKFVVSRLNLFPHSLQKDYVSPRELYTGIKPDFSKDVKGLSFGDYVQAHEDYEKSTNLPRERTRGCIALYPKGNSVGTWKFYSLLTLQEITRDNWTKLPIPDIVIEKMNSLYRVDEGVLDIVGRQPEEIVIHRVPNNNINDLVETEVINEVMQYNDVDLEIPEAEQDILEHIDGHEPENYINMPVQENRDDADGIMIVNDGGVERMNDDIGSVIEDGLRKSVRIRNRLQANFMDSQKGVRVVKIPNPSGIIFSMTRVEAYRKFDKKAEDAAMKELTQIYDRGTLQFIDKSLMTAEQNKKLIRTGMIFDDKYDVNGAFERLKARLVARGNEMDATLYEQKSSPTISTVHVMMLLAIAAKNGRYIRVLDIGNAFLEADMKEGEDVFVILDPVNSKILSSIDASVKQYMDERGRVVAKLKKALYGCITAAKLWFDKLSEILRKKGFINNPCDPCVMNKEISGKQISIGFHVDDLLVTCVDNDIIDDVVYYLKSEFREVKEKSGAIIGYLGMRLNISEEGIKVDMNAYTDKILTEYPEEKCAPTPASDDLFEITGDKELTEESKSRFHSCVAKLLYLAKRVRPDILLAISHLASRVNCPNEDDENKLKRVIRYLKGNSDAALFYQRNKEMNIEAYIDASFAIHSDGRSRTGMVIMMCGAAVCAWTSKQKMATKSSCEAEIVGLSDGSSEVMGCREFMVYQGHEQCAVKIYQDNKSVIDLLKAGKPTSNRTRHLKARFFFLKDYVDMGEVILEHLSTNSMLADYLTKPLGGNKYRMFIKQILGLYNSADNYIEETPT
jgi:hypothetical protein